MTWQLYSLFGITMASNVPFTSRFEKGHEKPDLTFIRSKKPLINDIWDQKSPDYSSLFKNEAGNSLAYLYRFKDCDVFKLTDIADFYISSDRIMYYIPKDEFYPLVEIQLLGNVFSYWLERQGIPAIHASVINVDGNGIGFLSSNKGGKTSIAASLMQIGYPLVTDDIMAIEHEDQICCRPGYPTMRMWPEIAEHFLGHFEDLPLVHPELSKRRVFVGQDSFGEFYNHKIPLKCLYIPERRDMKNPKIEIKSVSQGEGIIELVRHSFIANLVDSIGLQPKRLEIFTKIVLNVPFRRIIYPNGYEHLEDVCNAILGDLNEIGP